MIPKPNEKIFIFPLADRGIRPRRGDEGRKVMAYRMPGSGAGVIQDQLLQVRQGTIFRVRYSEKNKEIQAQQWVGTESPVTDNRKMLRIDWVELVREDRNRKVRGTAKNLWLNLHCVLHQPTGVS